MVLDGRKMKFASRKRLNQQKKAETQFCPTMPIHVSKKQLVGTNAFTHKSLKRKTLVRAAGFEPATSRLEGRRSFQLSYGRVCHSDSKTLEASAVSLPPLLL
jgi:hypothetical protein